MREMNNNTLYEILKMQFDNLHAYLAAKTDEERTRIREERKQIVKRILEMVEN